MSEQPKKSIKQQIADRTEERLARERANPTGQVEQATGNLAFIPQSDAPPDASAESAPEATAAPEPTSGRPEAAESSAPLEAQASPASDDGTTWFEFNGGERVHVATGPVDIPWTSSRYTS